MPCPRILHEFTREWIKEKASVGKLKVQRRARRIGTDSNILPILPTERFLETGCSAGHPVYISILREGLAAFPSYKANVRTTLWVG